MIKVVIGDDSPTCRERLRDIVHSDPAMQVVGVAGDGIEAVRLTVALRPDVVALDVQMPRLTGPEAARRIMELAPTPVVLVTSRLEFDAAVVRHGLAAGALMVVEKPRPAGQSSFQQHSAQLVEALKSMAGVKLVRRRPAPVLMVDGGD